VWWIGKSKICNWFNPCEMDTYVIHGCPVSIFARTLIVKYCRLEIDLGWPIPLESKNRPRCLSSDLAQTKCSVSAKDDVFLFQTEMEHCLKSWNGEAWKVDQAQLILWNLATLLSNILCTRSETRVATMRVASIMNSIPFGPIVCRVNRLTQLCDPTAMKIPDSAC
jgi:hypothetical protein